MRLNWRMPINALMNWRIFLVLVKVQCLNQLLPSSACTLEHRHRLRCPEWEVHPHRRCPECFLLVLHRLRCPEWVGRPHHRCPECFLALRHLRCLEWVGHPLLRLHLGWAGQDHLLHLAECQGLALRQECRLLHLDRMFYHSEWNPRRSGNWICLWKGPTGRRFNRKNYPKRHFGSTLKRIDWYRLIYSKDWVWNSLLNRQ